MPRSVESTGNGGKEGRQTHECSLLQGWGWDWEFEIDGWEGKWMIRTLDNSNANTQISLLHSP